jgi:Flp pilus assembly protein TadG
MNRTRRLPRLVSPRLSRPLRRGAALVELAVCLPMLVLVLLMALQTADAVYLKQSLHVAAYESARAAIKPRSTTALAAARGEEILDSRRIHDYSIAFTPAEVANVPPGEVITVTVTTAIESNTVLPAWYPGPASLSADVFMIKE